MSGLSTPYLVLFVCMGNICRSPAAEGIFRSFVQKAGYTGKILIDSAGTIGYHSGSLPDPRMQEAASRRGYKLDSLARQLRHADLEEFDLIIPMDYENYKVLKSIARDRYDHIRLLGSFLGGGGEPEKVPPVPDPYYGGVEGFEEVLDMLESACPSLLDYCLDAINSGKQ